MGLNQVIILNFGKGPEAQRNQRAALEAMEARRPQSIVCAYRDCQGNLRHAVSKEVSEGRDPKQLLTAAIADSRELASKAARNHSAAQPAYVSSYKGGAPVPRSVHGLW